jgi:hypothetical protein
MTRRIVLSCGVVTLTCSMALATIFGAVRGIIHDPQHRPVQGATVMLKSKSSEWTKNASSDVSGEFPSGNQPNHLPSPQRSVNRGGVESYATGQ